MKTIKFLSPRMVGKRFEDHSIPIELLKDFAAFEGLIVDLAKWIFHEENPHRTRLPRYFSKELSLHIDGIDEGSAIPNFVILLGSSLFPEALPCYEHARDRVIEAIVAADCGGDITSKLPAKFLRYFDKIGAGLRDNECIEFSPHKLHKAVLNKETRRKLILASDSAIEVIEDIILRGSIPEVDQAKSSFHLQMADGTRVRGAMTDQFKSVILEAFNSYDSGTKVVLHGSGSFNRSNKLNRIESVDQILPLDSNDIEARIEELRLLKNGWLDGSGLALHTDGLDGFSAAFEENYSTDLPLPYLYPTPEGNLLAEWSLSGVACSLEINLQTLHSDWHSWNALTGVDASREIDLNNAEGWSSLCEEIRTIENPLGNDSEQSSVVTT